MRYSGTLIAVTDIKKSIAFYHNILNLDVVADFGANVTLTGGIVLQAIDTWKKLIQNDNLTLKNNAMELYFEESDMDAFLAHLSQQKISYVHPPLEHSWGQRVVRFYDLDNHIIEVGEDMVVVVKKFASGGMNPEQIAKRMDVPLEYVKDSLAK